MVSMFKLVPEPLRKQILIKSGYSLLSLILLIAMLFITRDLYVLLPCAGITIFFTAATLIFFRRSALGEYMVIRGECQDVGFTATKRRIKYITLQTGDQTLRVMLHGRLKTVSNDAAIDLYVTEDTPVYENNGVQILYQYMAIDIKQRRPAQNA